MAAIRGKVKVSWFLQALRDIQ